MQYESGLHMDAFSLDHDKTGKSLAAKGKPLSDPLSNSSFGFGKQGSDTFSNAFTSVDSELDRLHEKFDDKDKKAKDAPTSMPMFSLFSSHMNDKDKKKDEKAKTDTSKLNAPVAKKEPIVTKETTLNIGGDIVHPSTPLELPTKDDQNEMRKVLGLEPTDDAGSTHTTTSFASLLDNGLI